jgi:phosphoribosylglycinamide formyltransferase 2
VIYGGLDARGIRYDGIAHALSVPGSGTAAVRQTEAYKRRRMRRARHGRIIAVARERLQECARGAPPRA